MKVFLVLLLFLTFGFASAQDCVFTINQKDDFTDKITIVSQIQMLFYDSKTYNFLTSQIAYSNNSYFLILDFKKNFPSKNSIYYFDRSVILLKSSNDSILRMKLNSNEVEFGKITHLLDEYDISFLKRNNILKIRIGDEFLGSIDFTFNNKLQPIPKKNIIGQQNINPQQYFKNSLRCIENELHSK